MTAVCLRLKKHSGNVARRVSTPTPPPGRSTSLISAKPTHHKIETDAQRLLPRNRAACHV